MVIRGKQKAKETFIVSLDNAAEQKQLKVELTEGDVKVKIAEQGKVTRIGSRMEKIVKNNVTKFFCNNYDVIAYRLTYMKGVSRDVTEYRLNMKKEVGAVKQKKKKRRNFVPDKLEVIKEEVNKLLNVKFVSKVIYPKWLANIVLVKKVNGKWRVYIYFIRHIQRIVTLFHALINQWTPLLNKLLSFLDA